MFGCRICNFDSCSRCASQVLADVDQRVMDEIDGLASTILEAAAATAGSHVTLLTNAHPAWVEASSSTYLPRTAALVSQGRVSLVSAWQSNLRSRGSWKASAVGPLAASLKRKFSAELASGLPLQVVSVGDQQHDLEAGGLLLELLTKDAKVPVKRFLKTVKLEPEPSAETLLAELRKLESLLPSLCGKARDSALRLGAEAKPLDDDEASDDDGPAGLRGWSKQLLDKETVSFAAAATA